MCAVVRHGHRSIVATYIFCFDFVTVPEPPNSKCVWRNEMQRRCIDCSYMHLMRDAELKLKKKKTKLRTPNAKYSGGYKQVAMRKYYGRTPIYLHRIGHTWCRYVHFYVVVFFSFSIFFFHTLTWKVWIAFAVLFAYDADKYLSISFFSLHTIRRIGTRYPSALFFFPFVFGYFCCVLWGSGIFVCSVRLVGWESSREQDYYVRYERRPIYYCVFLVCWYYINRMSICGDFYAPLIDTWNCI